MTRLLAIAVVLSFIGGLWGFWLFTLDCLNDIRHQIRAHRLDKWELLDPIIQAKLPGSCYYCDSLTHGRRLDNYDCGQHP